MRQDVKVTITVPDCIGKIYKWSILVYKKVKFFIRPFHCVKCGKRLYVAWPEYKHLTKSLMVHHHGEVICRECMAEDLRTKEWFPRFTRRFGDTRHNRQFWKEKKCDCCGAKVASYKDVECGDYVSLTLCINSWNSSHICKDCIIETIENGFIKTGIYNNNRCLNEKGLPIDNKGKLL